MVLAEQVSLTNKQVKRDYRTLWEHIGPKDIRNGNGNKPVPLQRSMLPERSVMIACICNHAPGCPLCGKELETRLPIYLIELAD